MHIDHKNVTKLLGGVKILDTTTCTLDHKPRCLDPLVYMYIDFTKNVTKLLVCITLGSPSDFVLIRLCFPRKGRFT
jgi:hypothetical protein